MDVDPGIKNFYKNQMKKYVEFYKKDFEKTRKRALVNVAWSGLMLTFIIQNITTGYVLDNNAFYIAVAWQFMFCVEFLGHQVATKRYRQAIDDISELIKEEQKKNTSTEGGIKSNYFQIKNS